MRTNCDNRRCRELNGSPGVDAGHPLSHAVADRAGALGPKSVSAKQRTENDHLNSYLIKF
jgi:hypothetical protein